VSAYDFAVTAVRGHLEELDAALALWETRDDTKAQPGVRRAASDAVDAIDAALRELHGIRSRLIPEIRASDDAAMARADALLADALERIRALEADTPQARQLQLEADLAAADLAESGYDRHGRGVFEVTGLSQRVAQVLDAACEQVPCLALDASQAGLAQDVQRGGE
jgi:hypothetical protein